MKVLNKKRYSSMNKIYKLISILNNEDYYFTQDLEKTRQIDGVEFYVVVDPKGRQLLVKKDSVKIDKTQ